MVRKCSIIGCSANFRNTRDHIGTFALPRDPIVREQWLQNTPEYVFQKKTARICQLHFRDKDIIKFDKVIIDNEVKEYPRKNYKLKSQAVPVYFINSTTPSPRICTSKFTSEKCVENSSNVIKKNISTSKQSPSKIDEIRTLKKDIFKSLHEPIIRYHDITNSFKDISKDIIEKDNSVKEIFDIEDTNTVYYEKDKNIFSENIRNLDDISEFYQHCEDLQRNWIFLHERNKAFLCHISLDADVATMDSSVCFFDDLRVVLAIKQEKVCEDYIPKYFKKIDSTDKLQDLIDFVMRIIVKAKKEASGQDQDHTNENSDNETKNSKEPTTKNINSNDEDIIFIREVIHPNDSQIKLVNKKVKPSHSGVNQKLEASRKDELVVNNSEECISESSECPDEETMEETVQQDEKSDQENEEYMQIEMQYNVDSEPEIIRDEEEDYEFPSDFEDKDDAENNAIENDDDFPPSEVEECEENVESNNAEQNEVIKIENDFVNEDQEEDICEEEEIDYSMDVTSDRKSAQLINNTKNIECLYITEDHEVTIEAERHKEIDTQYKPHMAYISEKQTKSEKLETNEDTEMHSESEAVNDLDFQNKSEGADKSYIELEKEQQELDKEEEPEDNEKSSLDMDHDILDNTNICCAVCKVIFNEKGQFLEHMAKCESISEQSDFMCKICNIGFHSELDLVDHLTDNHHDHQPYECPHCDEKFDTQENHLAHIQKHIVDSDAKQVYKSCEFCGKQFTSKSGYLNHLKSKHNEGGKRTGAKVYPCSECEKIFKSAIELDGHINGHKGLKPYTCDICERSYQSKISLYTHSKTHTGESKIYQCDQCEQTFTQKVNCVAHMRLHTGEKPFICEECGKSFTFVGLWKTHQRIHQGIMPYSCPVCFKSFHDKSSVRKHQIRQGHPGEPLIDENHIKVSMYKKKHTQGNTINQEMEFES